MHVSVDLCLIPIGVGTSLSPYIAECQKIFNTFKLDYTLHAYGTTVSGEWDTVFKAIKACHETCHKKGSPRIFSTIKCGTRIDKSQTPADKIASVTNKLKNQ
ncbi:hypothetical protein DID76_01015 [Candidatus Marinamargulisbacteria bacterium SCGC AG-414-C22]|nr:hypothetical protein DID76_01015 [Candidatus Marinamargulisbacteria bacterium SCGC AG-414-C22]